MGYSKDEESDPNGGNFRTFDSDKRNSKKKKALFEFLLLIDLIGDGKINNWDVKAHWDGAGDGARNCKHQLIGIFSMESAAYYANMHPSYGKTYFALQSCMFRAEMLTAFFNSDFAL